jgi:hypothetical protein
VEEVEAAFVHLRGDALDLRTACAPRRHRVVLVQPAHVFDLLPELLERRVGVEVAVDERRPVAGRRGRNAPVHRTCVEHLVPLLHAGVDVAAEALGIDVLEQARRGRRRERDRRPVRLAEPPYPLGRTTAERT